MPAKILLVDDEAAVLAAYERSLRKDFEVDTANGGELGLKAIRERGPYATVISDMRMPGMNGAQFLAQARQSAPDTVRMLLTGYTDLGAAMAAINDGNIYRFLTKPCAKEVMVAAITSGVEQYQLIRTEKELLEKTLLGCIKVMADFLSAASPAAFARSLRIVHYVRHIAGHFTFEFAWRLEAAAMLSQLGCVTLDTNVIQRALEGVNLTPEEQARFETHPQTAMELLAAIPRLEPTAWIIGQQFVRQIPEQVSHLPASSMKETLLQAKILKLAVAFDQLRMKLVPEEETITRLRIRKTEFGSELVDTLQGVKPMRGGKTEARRAALKLTTGTILDQDRRVTELKLTAGTILDQEVRNKQGMMLMAKGHELTAAVLIKLENLAKAGQIDSEVTVLIPPSAYD
jgi:ActR/RegA family two-component response regulator